MSEIKIVAEMNESTVVTEYIPDEKTRKIYQSEEELEKAFISLLQTQSYEYISINDEKSLILNLRKQLEKLNDYKFSDNEWNDLFNNFLANKTDGIVEKTRKIQVDYIHTIKLENGMSKNIRLIDKNNIHNNILQVINQYEVTGTYKNRYDVTILINGLPLVHIELKRRGVAIREAFNQINRYQRDSFWAGCGLFEYVQIFIISNGTYTKYYSNTTRNAHIKNQMKAGDNSKKTSNSFEFTSYWADASNKPIYDLMDFTKTFFSKHSLLNVLTRYCVFTTEDLLLVMRPYQIVATERILNKIQLATNYKWYGTTKAGGYIWHTTGSGKTLTSFKTAQLASNLPYIDKVLFIVDRKDLDYQTMKEYDRFEKGCANGNTSTAILQKQLENDNTRIIVTTIQKLTNFVSNNKGHNVYNKNMVLIFDECHRSQFGEFHEKITKAFKKYYLFGFTGTPIFPQNSNAYGKVNLKTTEQAFGDKLHTYTIVDAIRDENVLAFRIDFVNTVKEKEDIEDKKVAKINKEKALKDPMRVSNIVSYILSHFDQKTKRNSFYSLKGKRVNGFNSIFAVDSIPMDMLYYNEFKKQLNESGKELAIATIFSFAPNEEDPTDECFDTTGLDETSRDFLEKAIKDYNNQFSTSYDTSSDKFQNYYKDISDRMKKREIDLLIVCNMFLTGFDATTLNTLWVDKNLKYHGLIQAFSRTNRILNSVKTYGNIICFRDLQDETDEAIALFGDKDAGGIVLLKSFDDYYYGYEEKNGAYHLGYKALIETLLDEFAIGEVILGEAKEKKFIALYSSILKLINILNAFDQFIGQEILTERQRQDYQSMYLDLYQKYRGKTKHEKEEINDDLVFEMELIKQVEINIDYILMLIEKYHDSHCQDFEILAKIKKSIDSSIELRSKKELIVQFIDSINVKSRINDDWKTYVEMKMKEEIELIIEEERLNKKETLKYMSNAFRDGYIKIIGTDIDKIMPPISLFAGRNKAKERIIDKLNQYFEKYNGLV